MINNTNQYGLIEVELDKQGQVVAVWYGTDPLPFQQRTVDETYAREMREFYMEKRHGHVYRGLQVKEVPCFQTGTSTSSSDTPTPSVSTVTAQGE